MLTNRAPLSETTHRGSRRAQAQRQRSMNRRMAVVPEFPPLLTLPFTLQPPSRRYTSARSRCRASTRAPLRAAAFDSPARASQSRHFSPSTSSIAKKERRNGARAQAFMHKKYKFTAHAHLPLQQPPILRRRLLLVWPCLSAVGLAQGEEQYDDARVAVQHVLGHVLEPHREGVAPLPHGPQRQLDVRHRARFAPPPPVPSPSALPRRRHRRHRHHRQPLTAPPPP